MNIIVKLYVFFVQNGLYRSLQIRMCIVPRIRTEVVLQLSRFQKKGKRNFIVLIRLWLGGFEIWA